MDHRVDPLEIVFTDMADVLVERFGCHVGAAVEPAGFVEAGIDAQHPVSGA